MVDAETLKKLPLFAGLDTRESEGLARGIRTRNYRKGDVLFHRDDEGSLLYIIASGRVRIYLPTGTGEEVTLDILKPGEVFGELAVFDEQPRSASAVAIEDVVVLTLDRVHVLSSLQEFPQAAGRILAELSRRLRQADTMIEDIITLDVPGRLCKKVLQLAEEHGTKTHDGVVINMRLTQQDLASMIGATRESTNKVLRSFQSHGLVRMDGHTLIVQRPDLLRQRVFYTGSSGDS